MQHIIIVHNNTRIWALVESYVSTSICITDFVECVVLAKELNRKDIEHMMLDDADLRMRRTLSGDTTWRELPLAAFYSLLGYRPKLTQKIEGAKEETKPRGPMAKTSDFDSENAGSNPAEAASNLYEKHHELMRSLATLAQNVIDADDVRIHVRKGIESCTYVHKKKSD